MSMKKRMLASILPPLLMCLVISFAGYRHLSRLPDLPSGAYFNNATDFVIAVMLLSGKGFAQPDLSACPELQAFVQLERDSFDVASLPPDLPTYPPDVLQLIRAYNIVSLAVVWWLLGISWHHLIWLALVFNAAAGLAVYGIMRLTIPRWPAAVLTALAMMSPELIDLLPNSRDFSKVPFILALVWLMGMLTLRTMSREKLLLLAGAMGVLTGIGLGFRQDLIVAVPPALVVLGAFSQSEPRLRLRHRGALVLVYSVVAILTAVPVPWLHTDGGSEYPHNITKGMGARIDYPLGVRKSSYERVADQHDLYVYAIPRLFYYRQTQKALPELTRTFDMTPERAFVIETALTYPYDAIIRGFASVRTLLGNKWICFALVLLLVGSVAQQGRWGWGLLFLVLYFGAYPALQFTSRHYVHFAFTPYWIGGTLLFGLWRHHNALKDGCRRLYKEPRMLWRYPRWPASVSRAVKSCGMATLFVALPLTAAAIWQNHAIDILITRNTSAALELIETKSVEHGAYVSVEFLEPLGAGPAALGRLGWNGHYLAAKFEDVEGPLDLWLHHDVTGAIDLTGRRLNVNVDDNAGQPGDVIYYFPTIECFQIDMDLWLKPRSLVMSQKAHRHFRGLYRVDGANTFGLQPHLAVPSDMRNFKARQGIGSVRAIPVLDLENPFVRMYQSMMQSAGAPRGERRAALETASTALPHDTTVQYEIGILAEAMGDRAAAREHWMHALQGQPDFTPAAKRLAALESSAPASDVWIRALEQLADAVPASPAPHILIGKAYEERGDHVSARAAFEQAVALGPDEVAAQAGLQRQIDYLRIDR